MTSHFFINHSHLRGTYYSSKKYKKIIKNAKHYIKNQNYTLYYIIHIDFLFPVLKTTILSWFHLCKIIYLLLYNLKWSSILTYTTPYIHFIGKETSFIFDDSILLLSSLIYITSYDPYTFWRANKNSNMPCHHCRALLEDLALIVDKIHLVVRLIQLTMDMEPTEETDEKLDMLRCHLVADSEVMDNILFVLAVRCDACGHAF